MEYFIPEDSASSNETHLRRARQLTTEPLNTTDDIPFTRHEIQAAREKFDPRKAPGEDAINSKVLFRAFRNFPTLFTEVYNECLKNGHFPKYWKRSIIHPIVKPEKELSEMHKYRPISLINTGGKLLEKLLIDRINHHLHTNKSLNSNQFGFTPQKSTVDAAMAAKQYALSHIQKKNYFIMISLDIQGAFDSANWDSILNNLRTLKCRRNLYELVRSYFSDRVAILHTNTNTEQKEK